MVIGLAARSFLFLALLAATACGGKIQGGLDGGSGDGGPGSTQTQPAPTQPSTTAPGDNGGTGSDLSIYICPPELPVVGSACVSPGGCQYDTYDTTWRCQAFVCTAAGTWRTAPEGCP